MRKITRMLLPVLLLSAAVGSAMADMKGDVTAAYKAWDEAFNKGDAKAIEPSMLRTPSCCRPRTPS